MIHDGHRTQVLQAMPEQKRRAKQARTTLGAVMAAFGAMIAFGSFVVLGLLIVNGGTLDKWSAGLIGVLFLGGMVMVAVGSHVASGELVSAAWKDMATTVRSVWRRDAEGGS